MKFYISLFVLSFSAGVLCANEVSENNSNRTTRLTARELDIAVRTLSLRPRANSDDTKPESDETKNESDDDETKNESYDDETTNDNFDPLTGLPEECKTPCTVLVDFSKCGNDDYQCTCEDKKASDYADCMECVLAQDDIPKEGPVMLQNVYNFYQSMCNAAGVNVKDEEIKVGGAVRLGLSVAGTVVIAMTFATLL